jgi:hypothetical protein
MFFSVVFEKSGDSLVFQAEHPPVVEYFVECLDSCNQNYFALGKSRLDNLESKCKSLLDIFHNSKDIEEICGKSFPQLDSIEQLFDQSLINGCHEDWVQNQLEQFSLSQARSHVPSELEQTLLENYSDDYNYVDKMDALNKIQQLDRYFLINTLLHDIENSFHGIRYQVASKQWLEFSNPFSKDICTNNIGNFVLAFNHLGRSLYNKFVHFDTTLQYNDENTFDQLLPFVDINLVPAQTIPYSDEYTRWCNKQNRIPTGDKIILGNIPNLVEKVKNYRTILYRNKVDNNYFSIQLVG